MSSERPSLMLSMSALIAEDAPLTSPVSDCSLDRQPFYSPTGMDSFCYDDPPYSQRNSPSPPYSDSSANAERVLKMRMTPDYSSDASESQLCFPTAQVFDIPSSVPPSSPTAVRVPIKRPSSPSPSESSSGGACKKARSDRPTAKDFVPPDVSGLSKREARLVKNRAAAFLSRQRKREEFETMEVYVVCAPLRASPPNFRSRRVAELEQENARLQTLAQLGVVAHDEQHMLSEIDNLRAQLAAAEQRERELSTQLSRRSPTIKREVPETRVPASPARAPAVPLSQSLQLPGRSSTSLSLLVSITLPNPYCFRDHHGGSGSASHPPAPSPLSTSFTDCIFFRAPLQVLLCALPSIFSMPPQSQAQPSLPNTGSFPLSHVASQPFGASTVDFSSYFSSDKIDWRMPASAVMDLDRSAVQQQQHQRRLEFVEDADALGLGGLDISFDAEESADGKIRVRIHHPNASPSTSPSLSASYPSPSSPTFARPFSLDSSASWQAALNAPSAHAQSFASGMNYGVDPFFGVGAGAQDMSYGMDPSVLLGAPAERHIDTPNGRRRVRIALKSLPLPGTDGGEWEVELC
jgi:hypothetical protein